MKAIHHLRRDSSIRRALIVGGALALAACAAAPPAPIVSRTTPAQGATRPVEPPRVAAPAAVPAPAPAPVPETPAAQAAPIRSGSIESRAIESRPLDTRPAAPGTAAPAAPAAAPTAPAAPPGLAPNARTTPRGSKVPYSDNALAEMRAAEATAPPAAPPAAAAGSRAAEPKAPEPRPGESRAAEGDASGEWTWPAAGRMTQSFDANSKGISLGGRIGDPVVAAADGRVIFSGNGPRGYGNLVIVKHANDLLSVYAHNRSLAVKEGQTVKRGQKIAELGDSGTSSPRLHFEIRQQGKPVDPVKFLPRR
jgi:lipoprotein NlpD